MSNGRPADRRPLIRDDLASLVQQMIDRGIHFDDAQREFERMFIARALAKTNYNVCKAARMTGLHRNTVSRKMAAYKIRKGA
jgi:DNA-binding NtrC family response regulator